MVASDKTKVNAAIEQLKRLGYEYNDDAQSIIELCDLWYTNQETDFHTRKSWRSMQEKTRTSSTACRRSWTITASTLCTASSSND